MMSQRSRSACSRWRPAMMLMMMLMLFEALIIYRRSCLQSSSRPETRRDSLVIEYCCRLYEFVGGTFKWIVHATDQEASKHNLSASMPSLQ